MLLFQSTYLVLQGLRSAAFKIFKEIAAKWMRQEFGTARRSRKRPPWVPEDVWPQLLAYWESPEFLDVSAKNKVNCSTNKALHWHGGRKPANAIWEEMVNLIIT